MIVTQTVEIPDDRRITLEIPHEVPTGKAQIEFKVIPFVKKEEKPEKLHLTKQAIEEMLQNSPHTRALTGILHTDMTAKEIRNERLSQYKQ